jgi:hypothetical protein
MITLYLLIVLLILIVIILAARRKKPNKHKRDTSFLNKHKQLPKHLRLYMHENPNSTRISVEENQAYYIKYKTEYDPNYKIKGE